MSSFPPRGPPSFGRRTDEDARGGSGGGGPPARPQNERRRMLDVSREGHFKYDLREALSRSKLAREQQAAFIATIFSKGTRLGTVEAKDWVTSKLQEDVIAKPERDAINTLIDRYSKWR